MTDSTFPLLDHISSPRDLDRLAPDEMPRLAAEIREFILRAVSATGGHLGSNLGAVELTLALHRVFDAPHDIILWDTGHQSYVHKILTGRKDRFTTLRQEDGLSGYPSRAESDADWIENSHASTSLSYAHGIATALASSESDAPESDAAESDVANQRRVVAVIGDGALTGGMAFEGLNNLGHANARVLIVLNDNGRSYAPTVSRLSQGVMRLRGNPKYVAARDAVERGLKSLPKFSKIATTGVKSVRAALREVVEPVAFFEALGVRYIGPIDGHDVAEMEAVFRHASLFDGPILVHVLTEKGRGYQPAVDDNEKHLHDVKVFDLEKGPCGRTASSPDYTQVASEALCTLATSDERIHAITAAMPGPTGLLPFAEQFPGRMHDVGIAEQHAVTSAAGMAMMGLRPVVAVYSTFFTRAVDQALYDVSLHGLPVVFLLDRAGITGPDGPSHHGVFDLAFALRMPNMTIFAPSCAQELSVMLAQALQLDSPALIRFPKGSARQIPLESVGEGLRARKVSAASSGATLRVCLLGVGSMLAAAEDAAKLLHEHRVETTIWDVRVVKPLDVQMLRDAMSHDLVVVIEDGVASGGVGDAVRSRITQLFTDDRLTTPQVLTLGTPDAFLAHAAPEAIHERIGLTATHIADVVLTQLNSPATPHEV